jgi:LuxR family transcriptional regulator, maltose regulon positive regulatory protein
VRRAKDWLVSPDVDVGNRPRVAAPSRAPAPSPTDLPRHRLLGLLSHDPVPVTLVCGPAGSGKTSLLATWAATRGQEVIAWLGLERHDDDPHHLWTSVLRSLRSTGAFEADAHIHDLAAPPGTVTPSFVDAVLAEIATLARPVCLVLDDVHVLRQTAALETIGLLIRRLPPALRVVLASRTEPPLGLARLRVHGDVRDVHATDLAFTLEETAAYLATQGVDVLRDTLELLHRRTEGWIAGVRIASIALAADPDPRSLIDRFNGDDHAIAEYFLTEVVAALPEERLEFLMNTSICADLTVGLARRLSGREDAVAMLEELVRDNAFIHRLGRGREAYRYHELLRTYFAAQLEHLSPAGARRQHRIAASWHADADDPLHAMEHLGRAGDIDGLAALAARCGLGAVLSGDSQRLARLLEGLGPAQRRVPVLALAGAAAAMELDRLDDADSWLAPLQPDELATSPDPSLASLAAAVWLARARYTNRVDRELERLEATGPLPPGDPDLELYVSYHRGVARLYLGRYDDAITDLERATTMARVGGYGAVELACVSFLAGARASRSQWQETRRHADHGVALAERRGWARSPAVSHLYMLAGWSAYLEGDTSAARTYAALAVSSLGQHVDPGVELATRTLEVVVASHGPTPFAALRAYRPVFQRLRRVQTSPALLAASGPLLVKVALDVGERAWAQEFVTELIEVSPDEGGPALLRALLHVDGGNLERAARELEPVLEDEGSWHVATSEIRAWALAAEVERRRGKERLALEHLRVGLSKAEPFRFARPFLEHTALAELLRSAQGRLGRLEEFVGEILDGLSGPDGQGADPADRLTPTELELLRELPAPLSLEQLAEARGVSLNTVKSQLQAIYRKLGVHRRREAVSAGRRRGLL